MKKIALIYFISVFTIIAQGGTPPPNSILKNFKPFDTPRTNCRPGTVYRIDSSGIRYIVEDIKSIKSFVSREGNILGQMTFTKNQILTVLNLDFDMEFITAVVEIRNSEREYTEQAMVDNVLWGNDKADELMLDDESRYFIIRETILSNEITYRFSSETVENLITGIAYLKEKKGSDKVKIDFPFSISKRFDEPKRIFFLQEEIPAD